MSTQEFTALPLFSTVMSFMPGPNTTLLKALAGNFGWRHALRFIVAVRTQSTLMMRASGRPFVSTCSMLTT